MTGYDYHLTGGATISAAGMDNLGEMLSALVQQIPAKFVMVLDSAGQALVWKGDGGDQDIVILSSLIAADLAASREIGRMSGESRDYHMILREGERSHTFICAVGEHLILFALVPTDVPLGWSRKLVLDAAGRMEAIPTRRAEVRPVAAPGSLEDLSDELTRAIEGIWSE